MDSAARWSFLEESAVGLTLLTTLYIFLTAYRDFRDNFAAEIWAAIGYGDTPRSLRSRASYRVYSACHSRALS